MKRRMILCLAALMLALPALTGAEPAITLNGTTVWLGTENHLFLRTPDSLIRELPMFITDVIGLDEKNAWCLTEDGRLCSVQLGSTYSGIVSADPSQELLDAHRIQTPYTLAEGVLSRGEAGVSLMPLAAGVLMMAADDAGVWFVCQLTEDTWTLNHCAVPEENGSPLPVIESAARVRRPVSLTLTADAVTLVDENHAVQVYSPAQKTLSEFPAAAQETFAAAYADGKLFRYAKTEKGWRTESAENAALTPGETTALPGTPVVFPVPAAATAAPTSAPTARPTAAPTVRPTARPTATPAPLDDNIHKGDRGSRVRRMQQRLWDLGYPVGNVDGAYGDQTDIAVRLFLSDIGFTQRSYMTPKARNRLYAANAPLYDACVDLRKGDRGIRVRLMQQALTDLKYDPGKVDGVYGTKTVAAVAAYQQFLHIQMGKDEVPGELASRWLLMNLYDLLPDVTPTPLPTATPTPAPTAAPTAAPTSAPTGTPAPDPTETPAPDPTETPTPDPTETPTPDPTETPTPDPTETPAPDPTETPTPDPTETPTPNPTETPTSNPTETTDPTPADSSGSGNGEP